MEIWRIVKGYKSKYGCYRVSNLGRVKNGLGKELFKRKSKKGYMTVRMILIGGQEKNSQLHRVVAMAFIPNPDQLPQVNHLDGDKTNNKVSNLQWCTNRQNYDHAKGMGLLPVRPKGEKAYRATLSDKQALEIRAVVISKNGRGSITRKDLSEKYGVSFNVIKAIRNRTTYTHI
jgi:hypothetical protein